MARANIAPSHATIRSSAASLRAGLWSVEGGGKALGVLALAIPLVRAGKRQFLRQIAEQLVEPYSQGLASMSPTTATCSPSRAKAALWKALRSEGVTLVSLPWAVSNTDACVDSAPPGQLGDRMRFALIGNDFGEKLGAYAVEKCWCSRMRVPPPRMSASSRAPRPRTRDRP
ncbi:hypothetical protein A4R28_21260 [Mesorhizobium ciceri]|nr:hypothetical protein A4R28_21260 [Mesorhizobium ciceri]